LVLVWANVFSTSNGLPRIEPNPPVNAPARNLSPMEASGSPAPIALRTGASVYYCREMCVYIIVFFFAIDEMVEREEEIVYN